MLGVFQDTGIGEAQDQIKRMSAFKLIIKFERRPYCGGLK